MSKRDTGVGHSCLGHGCGFTANTSPPSKYEKMTTLMTGWAWGWHFLKPPNPVFIGNHGRKAPCVHFGLNSFFHCH